MNPALFFIGFFLLAVTGGFAYLGWTGQIKYGTRVLVDRRTDRLGFWVVYILFIVLFLFALTQFFEGVNRLAEGKAIRTMKQPWSEPR